MKPELRWILGLAASALVVASSVPNADAQRRGGGGHVRGGGGQAWSHQSRMVSGTANSNINHNVNRNINRNVNRNIDRDVNVRDVDVYHHGNWDWDDDDHEFAGGFIAGAATAAVIGSVARSVPPSCMTTVVNGITYQQCGSTWYQPQYIGTNVQYVVVSPPR